MDNLNIKPNSHKYKAEQAELAEKKPEKKEVEKVISGVAKVKKKSGARKFAEVFIANDIESVKEYALNDVVIPFVKKALYDIITGAADILIYQGKGGKKHKSRAGNVSYESFYTGGNRFSNESSSVKTKAGYSPDDVVVPTRAEAEDVLNRMNEIIENYGMVSVADLYDLVGLPDQYTDHSYGWKNIRNAEPIRVNDGYLLKLPKVTPLDK